METAVKDVPENSSSSDFPTSTSETTEKLAWVRVDDPNDSDDDSDLEDSIHQNLYKLALQKYLGLNYPAALRYLLVLQSKLKGRSVPSPHIQDVQLQTILANCYIHTNQLKEAEDILLNLVKSSPTTSAKASNYQLLAELYAQKRDMKNAIKYCKRTMKLLGKQENGDKADYHRAISHLVQYLKAKGDMEEAEAYELLIPSTDESKVATLLQEIPSNSGELSNIIGPMDHLPQEIILADSAEADVDTSVEKYRTPIFKEYRLRLNIFITQMKDPVQLKTMPLQNAILCEDKNLVKYLLESQGLTYSQQQKFEGWKQPLFYAALAGNLDITRIVLREVAFSWTQTFDVSSGSLPTHIAAYCGNSEVLKYLLSTSEKARASLTVRATSSNRLPMSFALNAGHLQCAKYMQEGTLSVGQREFYPEYLKDAIRNNQRAMVTFLIESGANLELPVEPEGPKPLEVAVSLGHLDLVKDIITAGAHMQVRYLLKAFTARHLHVFDYLLGVIVPTTLYTRHKELDEVLGDILHEAATYGYTKIVRQVLKHITNPNAAFEAVSSYDDKNAAYKTLCGPKRTALCEAILNERTNTALALAMNPKVLVQSSDQPESIAYLCLAIMLSQESVVAALLQRGCNLNERWYIANQTPLHLVAITGNLAIFELLISHGALPSVYDIDHCTAMHYAISYKNLEIVRRMARMSANNPHDARYAYVNWPNKEGNRPLHYLFKSNIGVGLYETLAELIAAGASVVQKNYSGLSVLHFAKLERQEAILLFAVEAQKASKGDEWHSYLADIGFDPFEPAPQNLPAEVETSDIDNSTTSEKEFIPTKTDGILERKSKEAEPSSPTPPKAMQYILPASSSNPSTQMRSVPQSPPRNNTVPNPPKRRSFLGNIKF